MKKWMFLSIAVFALPLSLTAQDDDMYFVPRKAKTTPRVYTTTPSDTYYSGSRRSVDEYNRWAGSSYEPLPTDTGDIISFAPVEGVYPDSVSDFKLTRQMARWDGYEPSQAYMDGYEQGRRDGTWRSWHSPWYYSSYYPWYDSWYYDPWYYSSWRYGWYDPWYYDYYWGYPRYHYGWYGGWGYTYSYWGGGPRYHYSYRNNPGTIDRYGHSGNGSFSGYRGRSGSVTGSSTASSSRFGRATTRGVSGHTVNTNRGVRSAQSGGYSNSGNFSGSRSSTYSSGSSSASGNFSGSRSSSSGSFSGSRSSGGGSFGGSRSSGGGGGARSGSSRR